MQERLQKILSARGIASRRKAEEYITAGLVKVNGVVAILGQKADPDADTIEIDGKLMDDRREMLYFLMNKPVGVETTNVERQESEERQEGQEGPHEKPATRNKPTSNAPSVRDLLPAHLQGKIYPVGRLDKDSSGLLLFTNDGVLSYRLTHPKFEHEKEYEVLLDRPMGSLGLRQLQDGFEMDGSMTKPLKAWKTAPNIIRIVLTEGKNRQIRRMCQHVGYTVKELRRIRIMTLADSRLKVGATRALTQEERSDLLASVSL
ncbi:MAG: rRNA pseudouridine synthase [Candidatus Peribacteraceae bacterium]|nr:rRNA pseudouridine synthase [Candidatus Peribacteraceae bacterium]